MEEEKKKIVVFDTNIYRDLTLGRDENSLKDVICRIVASEKEHDFSAYICPAVAGELIQHFEQRKLDCINGAKAVYWHCENRILPSIFEWNSEHYFNMPIGSHAVQTKILKIVSDLAENGIEWILANEKDSIDKISFIVQNENDSNVKAYNTFVHRIDPNYDETEKFLIGAPEEKIKEYHDYVNSENFEKEDARAHICAIFIGLSMFGYHLEKPSEETINKLVELYRKDHQHVFDFLRYYFNKILLKRGGFTPCPRANFVRDAAILSMLSWNIDSQDILVVTNDSDMLKYTQPHYPKKLLKLDEYLKQLGLEEDSKEIMQRIQEARKQKTKS